MAKKKNGAMAKWDQQLADLAKGAADQEAGVGGGQFFSTQNGVLKFNDSPLPGSQMGVIILDSVIENVIYEGKYDADNRTAPLCYAFGRSDDVMRPHKDVVTPQAESCGVCPNNEWGSAEFGAGKACRNRRRLAILSAGVFKRDEFVPEENPKEFETSEVRYLALPPTALRGYAAYVKKLAGALKRPPFAVFTRIVVQPDPKTQISYSFEALGEVPGELIGILMERNKAEQDAIEFPYAKLESTPSKGKRKAGKKKAPARKKKSSRPARKY